MNMHALLLYIDMLSTIMIKNGGKCHDRNDSIN